MSCQFSSSYIVSYCNSIQNQLPINTTICTIITKDLLPFSVIASFIFDLEGEVLKEIANLPAYYAK